MSEAFSNIVNNNIKEYETQSLNANIDNEITLYPSNWLYNASVIGFLWSLENVEKIEINNFLKNDGSVVIERDIFEKLNVDKRYFVEKVVDGIVGNGYFRNYINPSRQEDKKNYHFFVKALKDIQNIENKYCGVCNNKFSFDATTIDKLKSAWKKDDGTDGNFLTFYNGINKFSVAFSNDIAPSKGVPNSAWNCEHLFDICPLCSFLIIHHRKAFTKIRDGQMFINAPSFKLIWLLNKYADEVISKNESFENSQILGLSLMQLAQKISFTLGAWSIMNIEMTIKRGKEIDYLTIPYIIAKVLLNKDIASLIQQSGEFYILNLVLSGKFDMLLKLNNAILRVLCGGNKENSLIKELYKSDDNSLRRLANILPELYIKIEKTQTRRD
jgi:CRISPR-associated protein Cst1